MHIKRILTVAEQKLKVLSASLRVYRANFCYNNFVLILIEKLRRLLSFWTLILICLAAFSLLLYAAYGDSAITDELAHIPAGYGYVHDLDYRLNPEHPPLIKALAALPLLFSNPNFPTESSTWKTDVNGQWEMGAEFLYQSGNDANQIVRVARIAPILLTVLLIILIYLWSRELLGDSWALLPTFIFALSPTVLAHGHYVTTDVGAALGVVLATYSFLKFLYEPSRRHLIYAGITFGIAEIAKFSTVLLLPYFAILLAVFYLKSVLRDWPGTETQVRLRRFGVRALRYARSLIIIFAVGYVLIVYPIYYLFTINYPVSKQSSDTEFILTSFAGGQTPAGQTCHSLRCLADLNIWMSRHAATRPFAEYMLGVLMVLQRSAGGNTSYFLGEVSASGSRLYFPVIYLLKEPLPILFMILFALALSIWSFIKITANGLGKTARNLFDFLEINFTEFSMATFIVFYWAWSMRSPLNIGLRHLLPTIPFIYILAAGAWKRWVTKTETNQTIAPLGLFWLWFKNLFSITIKYLFMILLLVWFLAETVFAAPYFLSYFNEIAGGIFHGYRYVTDSNYDWGQDLLRLQKFVALHPEINKIAVDYFGGGDPRYYLGNKVENWQSSRDNPADLGIHWLAVSINTLQSAIEPLAPGEERNPQDEYRWLTALRPPAPGLGNVPEPDFRAGTSIFIYKL